MTFCIITHAVHSKQDGKCFGYAPYVTEMNIWIKNSDKLIIVAPLLKFEKNPIHIFYCKKEISFISIPKISLTSIKEIIKAFLSLPLLFFQTAKAISQANHIHLRCPGNIGLVGCIVQIFFPSKTKTAKYAGNWDPNAKQPISYKLQKWILSNTFLTRNMQVLVYGEWKNQSKNIKPFFTATYSEKDKIEFKEKSLSGIIKFLFVGTLSIGKRPLYAIQIVENLKKLGYNVALDLYGEGIEKQKLIDYMQLNNIENYVTLKGNQNAETVKRAYQESHFMILPSKSEGWPKAVAEAMFMGCLPISTKVSCVPNMLDYGNRGILLNMNIENDTNSIKNLFTNIDDYNHKLKKAQSWSQNYTIDRFEEEIKLLLQT